MAFYLKRKENGPPPLPLTFLLGEGDFSNEKEEFDSLVTEPRVALKWAPPQPSGSWPGRHGPRAVLLSLPHLEWKVGQSISS